MFLAQQLKQSWSHKRQLWELSSPSFPANKKKWQMSDMYFWKKKKNLLILKRKQLKMQQPELFWSGDSFRKGRRHLAQLLRVSTPQSTRPAWGDPSCQDHVLEFLPLQQWTSGSAARRPLETTCKSFICWLQGFAPKTTFATSQLQLGHFYSWVTEIICPPFSKYPDKNTTLPKPSRYTRAQAGKNIYLSTKRSHDNHIFI